MPYDPVQRAAAKEVASWCTSSSMPKPGTLSYNEPAMDRPGNWSSGLAGGRNISLEASPGLFGRRSMTDIADAVKAHLDLSSSPGEKITIVVSPGATPTVPRSPRTRACPVAVQPRRARRAAGK